MNVDLGVIGACAVSPAAGVSVHDASDATFKRTLLAASRKRLVLATTKNSARSAPHRVAELKDIEDCRRTRRRWGRARRNGGGGLRDLIADDPHDRRRREPSPEFSAC